MQLKKKIMLLPGDGIGPEVVESAAAVLDALVSKSGELSISYSRGLIGGCSIDTYATALTDETIADCLEADAVLLGAVGGPKWDDPQAKVRPEQGLLGLRKAMQVFANLRPVQVHPALTAASPLRPELLKNIDLLVVRELTGGLYFGQPKERLLTADGWRAVDSMVYEEAEIKRILCFGFELARARRKKLSSVDKANVLETSRLWRRFALEMAAEYPDVTLEHILVDTAAMRLVTHPADFDVLVTENMFGDILTDEAAVLSGSMGMLPSASLSSQGPGLYEPIHGSAPDIAGKGIANPLGTILSCALLLRHSFQMDTMARTLENAVHQTISDGVLTQDLGGTASTSQITSAVIQRLEASL